MSTLQELYSGSRELFEHLWIADKWDWSRRHPVVRLSLTGSGLAEVGPEAALHYALSKVYAEPGVASVEIMSVAQKLDHLIHAPAGRGRKVVVLIDEYDTPIVHYLGKDIETADANRDC